MRLKRMERVYEPGVVLIIRVTSATATGKRVRILIRRGKPPLRTDSCIAPGGSKPIPCEAA
jgi:hypothetical protein